MELFLSVWIALAALFGFAALVFLAIHMTWLHGELSKGRSGEEEKKFVRINLAILVAILFWPFVLPVALAYFLVKAIQLSKIALKS